MFLAHVVGDVAATHPHHNLTGRKLRLARQLDTSAGVAMTKSPRPGTLRLRELLASVHAHGDKRVSRAVAAPSASSSRQFN